MVTLHQLDAHLAGDLRRTRRARRGLGVAHDHVALAGVVRRAGCPGRGNRASTTRCPRSLPHARRAPCTARTRPRPCPRRYAQPAANFRSGGSNRSSSTSSAQLVEVDVVQRSRASTMLRARRPGGDLATPPRVPSGRRNHSMCVSPSLHPQRRDGGRSHIRDRGVLAGRRARAAAAPSTGSTGCAAPPAAGAGSPTTEAQTVRRRRPDAVERVLLADEELLEQRRAPPGRGGTRGEPAPQGVARRRAGRSPARRRRPAAWHEREADLGERERLGRRRVDQPVARARDPGGAQHLLHPRLVAHVARGPDVRARDAERLADLARAAPAAARARRSAGRPGRAAREATHGVGELPRVERVVHAPVRGEVPGEVGRHLLRGGAW